MGAERGGSRGPKSGSGVVDSGWQRKRVEAALSLGISLRRFNGWEPEQIHVHYDADGNETGRTVVTSEPEWDDEQRQIALDMLDYKRQICPGCGGHYSQTSDKSLDRDVKDAEIVCWDCDAIEAWRTALHRGHTAETCDCDKRAIWVDSYIQTQRGR